MLDILNNGKNSLSAFVEASRINTTNLGNVDTLGYKSIKYSFQSAFNRALSNGLAPQNGRGGVNPTQLGGGVKVSGCSLDFTQGDLISGSKLDVAINGNGLFIVSGDGGKTFLYTRAGNFHFNSSGYLADIASRMVYGYKCFEDGSIDKTKLEPIYCTDFSNVGWKYKGQDGVLVDNYANSQNGKTISPLFKIALVDFPNKGALTQCDSNTFKASLNSGAPWSPATAGENSLGFVLSGSLEKSNATIIGETIDLQDIQRSMTASLTAIKMASQQIQSVLQIVGN